MPDVYKLTSIFQLTTVAPNPQYAVPHTAGWTESVWSQTDTITAAYPNWLLFMQARARLLPAQGAIIGFRSQRYFLQGNQLLPRGTKAGSVAVVGRAGIVTDIPQSALQLLMTSDGSANSSSHVLRGIPDDYTVGGEFQPDAAFSGFLTQYKNRLTTTQFGFVGRDKAQATARVLSAAADGGVVLDSIPATGLGPGDWVRFQRTVGDDRKPVTRTYQVSSVTGNRVALVGWNIVISKPSGTLRRDLIVFVPYSLAYTKRSRTRKVGSPLEGFRGRRSKRRV